ncbi:hypothetical protein K438DRAFT_1982130 [Mycena galopus ATCC 62051]|nr:hypothetical protein K438DRAFT_1982130 [Mycena galopus ATCC 62051]
MLAAKAALAALHPVAQFESTATLETFRDGEDTAEKDHHTDADTEKVDAPLSLPLPPLP